MCVSMPYGKLDERISGLSDVMARMAIIVILMITAVLLSMFTGYAVVIRQKNRLLTREKASTEQALSLAEEASLAKSEFLSRMSHEMCIRDRSCCFRGKTAYRAASRRISAFPYRKCEQRMVGLPHSGAHVLKYDAFLLWKD